LEVSFLNTLPFNGNNDTKHFKGVIELEASMSVVDVITQIQQLKTSGENLNKKKIKQSNPQLMQNALFYFPSWEHALRNADSL
jgi:hypothetical protein